MAGRVCRHRQYSKGCIHCRNQARIQRKQERLQDIGRTRGRVYPNDLVPCGPAQEAILLASKAGIPIKEMSRIASCGCETLRRIRDADGETYMVRRRTVDKVRRALLAAVDDPGQRAVIDHQNVDPTRTKQIIRSLNAQGWTTPHLVYIVENNTGLTAGGLLSVTRESKKFVNQITEDKAKWLARQIGDGKGPSQITRLKTINRGYFPLRHYNAKGQLNASTLSAAQRDILKSVQS